MFSVGGKGSAPVDQGDDDSGDQEENQQNDRGKADMQQTNGYNRGGRGRGGRGFRGYRPRYIRRGGFRPQKDGGNSRVNSFYRFWGIFSSKYNSFRISEHVLMSFICI